MTNVNFILASSSPYRKMLLEKLQIPFETISPEVDETPLINENPKSLVKRLAILKAEAISAQITSPAIIIASDQVAVFDGKILGKPHTKANAIKQLTQFSGKQIIFYTSLSVLNTKTKAQTTIVEPFDVYFRKLSLTEITNYIDKEAPLNAAGSFKSEGLGIALFEKLEGDDPNTLIGLPLIKLCQILKAMGVDIL